MGSKLTFLEIKLKNNKGRTIKKRTKVKRINEHLSEEKIEIQHIKKVIGRYWGSKQSNGLILVELRVHVKDKERLTMDLNLTCRSKNDRRFKKNSYNHKK